VSDSEETKKGQETGMTGDCRSPAGRQPVAGPFLNSRGFPANSNKSGIFLINIIIKGELPKKKRKEKSPHKILIYILTNAC
jgi:hypothetical protein